MSRCSASSWDFSDHKWIKSRYHVDRVATVSRMMGEVAGIAGG